MSLLLFWSNRVISYISLIISRVNRCQEFPVDIRKQNFSSHHGVDKTKTFNKTLQITWDILFVPSGIYSLDINLLIVKRSKIS